MMNLPDAHVEEADTRSVAEILQHMREAASANASDPRATADEKRCWCEHLEMVVELETALASSPQQRAGGGG